MLLFFCVEGKSSRKIQASEAKVIKGAGSRAPFILSKKKEEKKKAEKK